LRIHNNTLSISDQEHPAGASVSSSSLGLAWQELEYIGVDHAKKRRTPAVPCYVTAF